MKNIDKPTETVIKIVAHIESRTNAAVDWNYEYNRYTVEADFIPILSFEKDWYIEKRDGIVGKAYWLKPSIERGIREFDTCFQMQVLDILNKAVD